MTDTSTAIACNLLEPHLRDRKVALRGKLAPFLTDANYNDGTSQLAFSKPGVTRQTLDQFMVSEGDCCSFLNFDLSETDTHFHLNITGPAGSEELVRNFFSTSEKSRCGCTGAKQSNGTQITRNAVGFITLCAIACAIPPALAALGLVSVATGAYIGRGIEAAIIALIIIGLGYVLVQFMKKKQGASS